MLNRQWWSSQQVTVRFNIVFDIHFGDNVDCPVLHMTAVATFWQIYYILNNKIHLLDGLPYLLHMSCNVSAPSVSVASLTTTNSNNTKMWHIKLPLRMSNSILNNILYRNLEKAAAVLRTSYFTPLPLERCRSHSGANAWNWNWRINNINNELLSRKSHGMPSPNVPAPLPWL